MGFGKIILGVVLFVLGLWLLLPSTWLSSMGLCFPIIGKISLCQSYWMDLWKVAKGIVPAGMVAFGFFMAWVEYEDMKMRPRKKK